MPNVKPYLRHASRLLVVFLLTTSTLLFSAETRIVRIPRGASAHHIAHILKQEHVIHHEGWFKMIARLEGRDTRFLFGRVKLSLPCTTGRLIRQLQDGHNLIYNRVMIPEGFTLYQIDQTLSAAGLITPNSFITLVTTPALYQPILNQYPLLASANQGQRLEGFLFPETYLLADGVYEREILEIMLRTFQRKVLSLYEEAKKAHRLPKIGAKDLSFYQLLTLASLVETEAQHDAERPLIAGIFLRRLNSQMALGACPTVLYARTLNDLPRKEFLSLRDVAINSAYNTYRHTGLPPTPIANPGIKSWQAALAPAHSDYLYFVAQGDGSHHFSTTYREHLRWQRRLKSCQPVR